MSNTVCQQDLVGFNFHNSGYPLTVGIPTTVNDALYIDTTALPNYSGSVTLNIGFEVGMTAVFASNGLTNITIPVTGNQLLAVPLIVTANDCGYSRADGSAMYWQFTIIYDETPAYGVNTGGDDPDPCSKPNRSLKVCRFDAKIQNKCYADFEDKIITVPNTDVLQDLTLNFDLGLSPQCTGPVTVVFTSECTANLDFEAGTTDGVTYTLGPGILKDVLTVTVPYGFEPTIFNFRVLYDVPTNACQCTIKATITYDNANNPNLVVNMGNNGSFSGIYTQATFNTAGVLARTSSIFSFAPGDSFATALRVTVSNPVDQTNDPDPSSAVNPTATDGSIFWQGDIGNPEILSASTRYWIKARMKQDALNPVIKANEELHVDKYNMTHPTSMNVAVPYLTQYSPKNQWLDLGLRFITTISATQQFTPMVRYFNTFASGSFATLIGDLLLNNGSVSDWGELEIVKYYPCDPIECPERYLTIQTLNCDYVTELELDIAECETTGLIDNSDFGFTPGHDRSDFTLYRKVTVTLPSGQQEILASQSPYDILIDPPASGALSPFYSGYPITMGGVYTFTMCNIPTYRNDVSYKVGDNVVLVDGAGAIRFFECIQSSPGKQPLVVTGWANYWTEIPENEFNSKYCDTQTYVNLCAIRACIREYKNKLICSLKEICQNNLCDNECVKNYFMLQQMLLVMESDEPETDEPYWTEEQVNLALNLANQLCITCNCQ